MKNRSSRFKQSTAVYKDNAIYYSISCSPGQGKTAWNFNMEQTVGELMYSITTLLEHKKTSDFDFDISIFYDNSAFLQANVRGRNLHNFVSECINKHEIAIRLIPFDSRNEDNMSHKWSNLALMSARHKKVLYVDTDVYFLKDSYNLFKPLLENPEKAIAIQVQPWAWGGPPKPQNITYRYFKEKLGWTDEQVAKTLQADRDKQWHTNGTYAGHALFNTELLPNFSQLYKQHFTAFTEFAGTPAEKDGYFLIETTKDKWCWTGANPCEELSFHLAVCVLPEHTVHKYDWHDIFAGSVPRDYDSRTDTLTPIPHTPDTCWLKQQGFIMHHTMRKYSSMYFPEEFSPDGHWFSNAKKSKCEYCSVV
tara:strand:- start:353 stop:1444 length:1092 start_codon:yes stop_codon:yes gene_type:complete